MPVYKEDIEGCKRRVDAWWNHEIIDRVVVQVRAPRKKMAVEPIEPLEMTPEAVEQRFLDPELFILRLKRQLSNTYFGGEAFPVMFLVTTGRMVAITAAYLGCPLELLNTETVGAHPAIVGWQNRPIFQPDPGNTWWQRSQQLLNAAVEGVNGYFVGFPDLNGPTEILARLRGTQALALDFYENP